MAAALTDALRRGFWGLLWLCRTGCRWINQSRLMLAGLVLLGLILNLAVWCWADAQQSQWANEQATRQMAEDAARTRAKAMKAVPAPAVWGAFEATLVPADGMPTVLHDLLGLAESLHVDVLSGEYTEQPDRDGGFVRQQLSMPVRGSAASVRRFIEDGLAAHPGLALQGLEIKRGQMAAGQVEASVQWTLLARPRPPSGEAK